MPDVFTTIISALVKILIGYVLLGLVCSTIVEMISATLNLRGAALSGALKTMLKNGPDSDLHDDFYAHPLISSLRFSKPSYIPPRLFALVVNALVAGDRSKPELAELSLKLQSSHDNPLHRALGPLLTAAGDDLSQFLANVEQWFISAMDGLSGVYRLRIQLMIVFTAAIIIVGGNIDSIAMYKYFQVSAIVEEPLKHYEPQSAGVPPLSIGDILNAEGSPIGWSHGLAPLAQASSILSMLIGWLITLVFTSIAATAVFDWLTKYINMRVTGPRPSDSARANSVKLRRG